MCEGGHSFRRFYIFPGIFEPAAGKKQHSPDVGDSRRRGVSQDGEAAVATGILRQI